MIFEVVGPNINPRAKYQTPQGCADETKTKKNRSKTTKTTIKKSNVKTKNKLKNSEIKVGKEEKKELVSQKDQSEIREIKSSSPIEITQINEISSSEKPKKKGWWSQ